MKKIIISDFDKTLYCDEENLKINIEKISGFRNKGNLFVIATGRSFKSLEEKLKKYSIPFDYLILSHGTVILDKNKELILNYNIENNIVENIINHIEVFKEEISSIKIFDIYDEDVEISSKIITKFRVLTKSIDGANEISNYINKNFGKFVKSYVIDAHKYIFTEIISIDTDKGNAIEKILKLENIEDKNVYAIGDGSNDIEMISKYNGFGMINSEECVINVATKLYDNVYNLIDEIG
jgi:HAD superfamily hydrolase (TIGR01484 family)